MVRVIDKYEGVYIGNMKAGQKSGKGKLVDKVGTYEGLWVNSKKQGLGKLTYNNKTTLDGYWNADVFW